MKSRTLLYLYFQDIHCKVTKIFSMCTSCWKQQQLWPAGWLFRQWFDLCGNCDTASVLYNYGASWSGVDTAAAPQPHESPRKYNRVWIHWGIGIGIYGLPFTLCSFPRALFSPHAVSEFSGRPFSGSNVVMAAVNPAPATNRFAHCKNSRNMSFLEWGTWCW